LVGEFLHFFVGLSIFTDIDAADLKVSQPMRMMFRIKDIDSTRGFRRYFWKATPVRASATA
jgi:hypothetical protein